VCFIAGTPITTDFGDIAIDQIVPEIHTINNKKILKITKTISLNNYLVCFDKNALGINYPSQKTIMSSNHSILYNGKMIKAKNFINVFKNVYKIAYNGDVLYNVLMEKYDTITVNNLICETLNPENYIALLYRSLHAVDENDQTKIISEINNYVKDLDDITKQKIYKSLLHFTHKATKNAVSTKNNSIYNHPLTVKAGNKLFSKKK